MSGKPRLVLAVGHSEQLQSLAFLFRTKGYETHVSPPFDEAVNFLQIAAQNCRPCQGIICADYLALADSAAHRLALIHSLFELPSHHGELTILLVAPSLDSDERQQLNQLDNSAAKVRVCTSGLAALQTFTGITAA